MTFCKNYIKQISMHNSIVGDFNVNTMETMASSDRYVNEFHNTFLTYFYHPLITEPTLVFKAKNSILDNIYTNYPKMSANGILKTLFSDRYSMFCISKEKQNNRNNIIVIQEFTEQDISLNSIKCSLRKIGKQYIKKIMPHMHS